MSATDYLLNIVLIGLVVLQIRGRRMTSRTLVLPLVIVGVVAVEYLHGIPTAGNDLLLVLVGAGTGAVLGILCGAFTTVRTSPDGTVVAKAGVVAAVLWVLGVGARLAFVLYTTHGGQDAVGRFMVAHRITSSEAWVACLVLMALAEVLGRTGMLAWRWQAARQAWTALAAAPTTPAA